MSNVDAHVAYSDCCRIRIIDPEKALEVFPLLREEHPDMELPREEFFEKVRGGANPLSALCQARNLSLEEACQKAGVEYGFVNNGVPIGQEEWQALAEALGIPNPYLIDGTLSRRLEETWVERN